MTKTLLIIQHLRDGDVFYAGRYPDETKDAVTFTSLKGHSITIKGKYTMIETNNTRDTAELWLKSKRQSVNGYVNILGG
jgi:hypothetical protein